MIVTEYETASFEQSGCSDGFQVTNKLLPTFKKTERFEGGCGKSEVQKRNIGKINVNTK